MEPFLDIVRAWSHGLPFLALAAVAALAVSRLVHRASHRVISPSAARGGAALLLVGGLAAGLRFAWGRMALFDDAYISLRYARNFAEGHGLVWNLGERVEGYTNFLWTVLLALGIRLRPGSGPTLAIALCLLTFVVNVLVVARIGRRLTRGYWLPLAAAATATNWVFSSYATTGMETGFAALMVLLGVERLLGADRPGRTACAALFFILAALCRPDHGLFYAVGSAVVGWEGLRAWGGDRRAVLRRWGAWAAPFALYLLYLGWKLQYYGQLLPNTYYAKSADLTWWSQGAVYSAMFWLGANAWPAALAAGWFALRPGDPAQRRFGAFSVASVILYTLYTARVGGDFMYGRFFVTVLPLALLGAEALVFSAADRPRVLFFALFALIASSAPVTLFDGTHERWGIVDENLYWRVDQLRPEVRVRAVHYKLGRFLRDQVKARGIEPVLGTGGIGMVGYYSGLPLIDSRGLTDATIAHQPLARRTRPGHEKVAPRAYILQRGVNLLRLKGGQRRFHPKRFRRVARISFRGAGIRDDWQIARYDRGLMERLREVKGVDFVDFDRWLDRYVAALDRKKPREVRRDLPWLKDYWFDVNDDPARLALIEARAAR